MQHRFLTAACVIAGLVLSACGGGTATPTLAPTSGAGTLAIPTNLPMSTATLPHGGTPEILAAPDDLTGHELLAEMAGSAIYSGYSCTIVPEGCACETPVLIRADFTFKGGHRMDYNFVIAGQSNTWEFTDIGPSHWEYTLNYQDEPTGLTGTYKVWLEFTDVGFVKTEFSRSYDDTMVTCPDVTFRRIAEPTTEPAAEGSPTP